MPYMDPIYEKNSENVFGEFALNANYRNFKGENMSGMSPSLRQLVQTFTVFGRGSQGGEKLQLLKK